MYLSNLIKAKSQPEVQGKRSEPLLKKFLKKLEKYKSTSAMFDENFPLYVVLALRMHRYRSNNYVILLYSWTTWLTFDLLN